MPLPTPTDRQDYQRRPRSGRGTLGLGAAALVAAACLTTQLPDVDASIQPVAAATPARGELSNGCTYGPRGLPSCGAYLGAAYGANTDPAALERRSGRRLGVRRTYFDADQVEGAVQIARQDLRAGRLPWISFKVPYSWEDMAGGRGDDWARDLSRRLARLPGPVWLAFHHEPEGDGDVQAWRLMQERLAPLVRSTAPNVAYTVILTGYHQFFGNPAYSLDAIWPRGVKIDVIGIDVYNEYGVVKHGRAITEPPHLLRNYFRPLSTWAKAHHVAWGVAETGVTDEGAERYPRWIEGTYGRLVRNGGVALAYFDTTLNAYGSWELATRSKEHDFSRALVDSPVLPD